MKHFFIILFFSCGMVANAQDTIRVMHYNLLNFGNTTSYCTPTNNNLADKEGYLKTIVSFLLPDILTVNEIAGNTYIIDRLMDTCLNINGITYYQHANYVNSNASDIVSMLYYNADKFTLQSQETISTNVRDILLYKLYYRASDLASGDTAFLIPVVAHLKAGSSTSDENERAAMTAALMNHLNISGIPQNYLFSGDMNLKTSNEQAYQNLLNDSNTSICFLDPISVPGNWYNNSSFATVHTQSTHTANNGCASTGGMDDRFDIILANENIINGLDHFSYVSGSYKAVGNDGLHFNNAINDPPTNNSVPSSVLDALYNMSDHLPVVLDLSVDKSIPDNIYEMSTPNVVSIINPTNGSLELSFSVNNPCRMKMEIISLQGQKILAQDYVLSSGKQKLTIPVDALPAGLYFLRILDKSLKQNTFKFINY